MEEEWGRGRMREGVSVGGRGGRMRYVRKGMGEGMGNGRESMEGKEEREKEG